MGRNQWATHSRLPAMIEKTKMLASRLPNILTDIKHHITNAASESINSKIQCVKYTARGFRNFDNFVTAIYFHCGGLELTPSATKLPQEPSKFAVPTQLASDPDDDGRVPHGGFRLNGAKWKWDPLNIYKRLHSERGPTPPARWDDEFANQYAAFASTPCFLFLRRLR